MAQRRETMIDSEVVQRLRQAAHDLEGQTVAFTQELVRIPTENPKLAAIEAGAEATCQDVIEARLRALGCTTERWEVYPGRPDLVGTLRGEGGEMARSLILNGHIDVVPAGDPAAWTYAPFAAEIADGKIWGRGTVDMKGGIAAMITAVEAIQLAGIRLQGDVLLESVVDEETGGPGTMQTIEHGYRADAAIVVEPTDFAVQPVEGGLEWLRVVVRGRSGHSAYRYRSVHAGGQGVAINAIEKTAKILAAVQDLERHWAVHKRHPLLPAGITTINPGVIIGGTGGGQNGVPNVLTAVSTFPDYCALELSLKYLPGEETANVRAEFEDYISRVACRRSLAPRAPAGDRMGNPRRLLPAGGDPCRPSLSRCAQCGRRTDDRVASRGRRHGCCDGPGVAGQRRHPRRHLRPGVNRLERSRRR